MDAKTEDQKNKLNRSLDVAVQKTEKTFIGFFIRNYRFTYLMAFIIIAVGSYSALVMPKEAEPEVEIPFAVVTTVYPGGNPADIEELITEKVESKVKNLENVKQYNSTSAEGYSSVFVEYEAGTNLEENFRKLREAADEVEAELPEDAETPAVSEVSFNDFPIVTYSLVGDYSEAELKTMADLISEELRGVKDVSKVEILGGLEREFLVTANQAKLANFNISLGQVINAISISNLSLPAGDIEIDGFKYNVRVKGKFQKAEDLENVVIATYDNSPVFLRDIARAEDGYKEKNTESRIGFMNEGSKNTISIQIYKRTGGNILNIVENSQSRIDELIADNSLPADIRILKTNDNSTYIKDDLRTLGTSAVQTVVLITVILMAVLSLRGAMITALAVPLAFLMTFLFLNMQGMTLNSMVLFSLVLSLGLMVDNSIIIMEGVNEYSEKYGRSMYEAALLSVWNFKWAITAGTLTTVAAFVPMFLVSGILGEYLQTLPKTISITLLSSLFVALVVIPTLVTRFIKKTGEDKGHRDKKRHRFIAERVAVLHRKYENMMRSLLPDKKKRRKLIGSAVLSFVLLVIVPLLGLMPIEMFPKIDMEYFVVNIKLPVGSNLDKTRLITEQIEERVMKIPELDNFVTNLGTSASLGYGGGGGNGAHLSSITVNLADKNDRERTSYEISGKIRAELESFPGADVRVEELSAGPPTGSPIEIRIFGDDLKQLSTLSSGIKKFLEQDDSIINIKDNLEDAAGEFVFTVDKQQANYYGLSIANVAGTLRNAVYGTKASQVNINGDDVDITVKYDQNFFASANDLENILLFTPAGTNIPLKQIADVSLEPSLLKINHRDGEKVVVINADITSEADLRPITENINEYIDSGLTLPEGYSVSIGGEVEEIEKSFREVFLSMGVAILLIAMILVLQFNSFKQPFIIIFTLPLAIIGVMIGLNLLRMPFSFTAFIGIVSLAGIVVNDSIVLLDRINKNIASGLEFYNAIIEGGVSRMQPIFLTSLTTIAGVFPLIWANELWRGFSIAVIFGLAFSTLLTLIVIPVFFVSLCQKDCGQISRDISKDNSIN